MSQKSEPGVRLQVYLARAGLGSRRSCEEYVASGRVRVDGRIIRELGTRVAPGSRVEVDGRVVAPEPHVYLAVNKPAGYVCSNRKMDDRPIVGDLYRGVVSGRLFHVGRLDALSTGLILVTNDGDFANAVAHPSREVEREYLIDTVDSIPDRVVDNWRRGVTVDGVRYVIRSAERHSATRLSLTLVEGKNREIRRILEAFGIRIRRVHRVRVGPVRLRSLRPGAFRPLTREEVKTLSRESPRVTPAPADAKGGRRARFVHKKSHGGRIPPLT
jgi:23S rRNA pseudouridine2605 synthase